MPFNLALADLVTPYLVLGENLGASHAALSALRVVRFETAREASGVVIRGEAQFNGSASIDVANGRLLVKADVDEGDPPFDPDRRTPVFDIRETSVEFELFVVAAGSAVIGQGVAGIAAPAFTPTRDVLNAWDAPPIDPAPSDFPASGFVLDLILKAPSVRPPFLHPAKMTPEGILIPDPAFKEVEIRLPKLRFRLAHTNDAVPQLRFSLVSAGTAGLDDPGDIGAIELISMEPPYAFIGRESDRTVGIGFRSATLDLSDGYTPPAITAKFGFGDDWSGLYLPELRFFVAPEGARDFAFEVGVRDLLIGFGEHAGISGDFEAALINQGDGALKLSARFFDETGRAYGITKSDDTHADAYVPASTKLVVDLEGGRAPYTCNVSVDGAAPQAGRVFAINLGTATSQEVVITASDSTAGTPITVNLTITVHRKTPQELLPTPGTQTPTPGDATIAQADGSNPIIEFARKGTTDVELTTRPPDPNTRWTIVGSGQPETAGQSRFTVPLAAGETKTVRARIPGTTVPTTLDYYFYFDEPDDVAPASEATTLGSYAATADNVSTVRAKSTARADGRDGPHQSPAQAYRDWLDKVPNLSNLTVQGEASYEGVDSKRNYNYLLARRRAIAIRELIKANHSAKSFAIAIDPEPSDPASYPALAAWTTNWKTHGDPGRQDWWKATVTLPPGVNDPERSSEATLNRPAIPPPEIKEKDPPPPAKPRAPDWFRSMRLKVRIVRNTLVAVEIDGEIDVQTATEEKLASSGQLGGEQPPDMRTLESGAPLAPDNPADGITRIKLLAQTDNATGKVIILIQVGADPADKDGLIAAGWLPGETMPAQKDFGLTLLGSYISFWPLLAAAGAASDGDVEDAVLVGAALTIPGVIALLPWFRVERIILFGGEYLQRTRDDQFEAFLLFDVEVDWSVDIQIGGTTIIEIEREHPLAIRYKAIGLRLGNFGEDGSPQFSLRPVFDSSRGYTIDVAKDGSLKVAEPFDKILKVLAARLSKTNPLTFEADIAMAVDLGVVSVERAGVRVYLDQARPPELTALAAGVNIPGAISGRGYMEIAANTIGGQMDLTIVPISLRVAAALEIAQIPASEGGPATGVYFSLNVVLPVGIPLGQSGLGIFGFRGIFGMHYERNPAIGAGTGVPALRWLEAADGQPHLLEHNNVKLWTPHIDRWAFGLGILIGTMEGGVIMNLDGTFLLELPGPRVLIILNARILTPPPSVEEVGTGGGILAVIEITPEHFLIGIVVTYEIPHLLKVRVPVEAVFSFGDVSKWHIYLGSRAEPVEVDVLGIVKGTGYLMFEGDGLPALPPLPAVPGFAIGLGAGASFIWGSVDAGLYVKVGGKMDSVVGFDPFLLAGHLQVNGELRLFIVSVGAHADLTVTVAETSPQTLTTSIDGKACGHVDFFFFSVEGCVHITLGADNVPKPAIPDLVSKLSLKSRSPALAQGTGTDRGIDTSLGDGLEQSTAPNTNDDKLVTVPIDSIPILSMVMPPVANNLKFMGQAPAGPTGAKNGKAQRGAETYVYDLTAVTLERADGGPAVIGAGTPATWWLMKSPTDENTVSQLALLTWDPAPAMKAIEKSEVLTESIEDRWGTVCSDAAEPAHVLWTFRFENLGPSLQGWQLDGIAWPDPPGTVRSEAPDTVLDVTERWRTGDANIDGKRGIVPAVVVGAHVRCDRPDKIERPDVERPRLVIGGRGAVEERPRRGGGQMAADDDPVLERLARAAEEPVPFRISPRLYDKVAGFEPADPVRADITDIAGRIARGEAVPRMDIVRALTPAPLAAAVNDEKRCEVRVLQAPMLDDGRLVVLGNPANEEAIKKALDEAGVTHGPLDDVVVVHSGAYKVATMLLFVRGEVLRTERLVVRVLSENGDELFRMNPTLANEVPATPLPGRWTDPSGPWADDIADLVLWPGASGTNAWLTTLVDLPAVDKADRIEIGVVPDKPKEGKTVPLAPAYYVGAIELLRLAEVDRFEWDETEITKDRDVVTNFLGPASTDNALLFPGSLYKVTATWTGERESDSQTGGATQTFWFKTDSQAPERLDPWVLMTIPGEGEQHYFGGEPVRIVFNTHDIDRLFGAYGKELRIRLQAASSHHPEPTSTVPHPFPIDAITLTPAKAAILAPYEEALLEVLAEQGPCVPVDEDRSRQSTVTIPIPLDPYTDYLVDIVAVNQGATVTPQDPFILRRHLSTGAYRNFREFATSLQGVVTGHRAVAPGAMEAIRAFFNGRNPEGPELDEQLRAHGIEAIPAPDRPRVTVFWEQSGSGLPQPAAVVVDAREPLWRSRLYPTKETDNSGPVATERWVMAEKEWLFLRKAASSDPIAANGLLRAPGSQRALVVLPPGSRGKHLVLELVAAGFPEPYLNIPQDAATVVDLEFDRAPWEEE